MNELTLIDAPELSSALTTAEIDATMGYATAEKALATREAYASDWRDLAQVQDTCKKWSQGHLERKRLGIEGAWQSVHVQDVLAKATDVLAHVGAEARDQTRGNRLAVFGHMAVQAPRSSLRRWIA